MRYLIAILLALSVSSEPKYYGIDDLGLAKQNIKIILDILEPGMAYGTLQGTFGNVSKKLNRIAATGKVSAIRVHLINGPCWRNQRCEAGEPRPTDFRAITTRAKDMGDLIKKHPGVECYISPVLEHDEKNQKVVNRWFTLIEKVAPHCKKVCNSFTGWCPENVLKEKHGNNPGQWDIVSNDGESIFQSNSIKYRTYGRVINFAWYPESNLLYDGMKSFIPPSQRTCQSTKELYQQALLVLKQPNLSGESPCLKPKSFEMPELLKTNAESYCNSDPRGNKLLVMVKAKVDKFDVLTPSGKKIGCAKYYGSYENGTNRYYVGSCSGQNPVELYNQAGGETIYFKAGTLCYKGNAIRRMGYYK